jgi:hypothetical protein
MILRSTRARCQVAWTELRKEESASVDSTLVTFQRLFVMMDARFGISAAAS